MNQTRCIILIDGSNFYFKLKGLQFPNLLNFDFSRFITQIIGSANHPVCIKATYYVGEIKANKSEKSRKLLSEQRKLLSHLNKHHILYSLGHLLKSDGRYHEKGVDVKMAVDILVASYEDECDHIFLISSDSDLVPAVLKAREKGKRVTYVGFSHQPTYALLANATDNRLLTKEDLAPFLPTAFVGKAA